MGLQMHTGTSVNVSASLYSASAADVNSEPSASVKSRLVLPIRYRLTWVVPDKGPLNGCVCVSVCVCVAYNLLSIGLMYVKKFTSFCQVLKMHTKENWFILHGVVPTQNLGFILICYWPLPDIPNAAYSIFRSHSWLSFHVRVREPLMPFYGKTDAGEFWI